MKNPRNRKIRFETELVRIGDCRVHALLCATAFRQRLGDDADVVDAGLTECVDDGSENTEGNRFIAAKINRVLRLLKLRLNFAAQFMNVDGVVAKVHSLSLVDGDHQALLSDFMHRFCLWDVDFDAGLKNRGSDHEDDEEHENDVDERDHVDLRERRLCLF